MAVKITRTKQHDEKKMNISVVTPFTCEGSSRRECAHTASVGQRQASHVHPTLLRFPLKPRHSHTVFHHRLYSSSNGANPHEPGTPVEAAGPPVQGVGPAENAVHVARRPDAGLQASSLASWDEVPIDTGRSWDDWRDRPKSVRHTSFAGILGRWIRWCMAARYESVPPDRYGAWLSVRYTQTIITLISSFLEVQAEWCILASSGGRPSSPHSSTFDSVRWTDGRGVIGSGGSLRFSFLLRRGWHGDADLTPPTTPWCRCLPTPP